MILHNLYLFDRHGSLLFYHEWARNKNTNMSKEEEAKLLYGMIFSLKSFVNRLSPMVAKEGFLSYKTSAYRLNFFETVSSLKFILNTDNETSQSEIRELLSGIYRDVYVEYAAKSPMVVPGEMITSNLFRAKLVQYVQSSHNVKSS
jgi:type IV secretory pathway VirB6-like protein